jgi:hypothetical protein
MGPTGQGTARGRAVSGAAGGAGMANGSAGPGWTFLTNHAHVLLAIAGDPEVRMRDVAASVGVTERAVQMIVADLETAGYLARTRVGRRNRYTVNDAGRFRHPAESEHRIGELLALFVPDAATGDPAHPVDGPSAARTARST